MSKLITSPRPRLPDLDAPLLDLTGRESAETVLMRLQAQNDALASLREALAFEESRHRLDVCVAA